MLLNKANLEIAKLVAQEESRYSINSIYVTKKETVVTDGHQLTIVSTPDPELAESFPMVPGFEAGPVDFEPFLLHRKSALELAGAIPKKSNLPILKYACIGKQADDKVAAVATDLESPKMFSFRKPGGTFPNYMVCVPDKKPKFTIAMDPRLLEKVFGTIARCLDGSTLPCVKLQFYSAEEQMRIDARNSDTGQWITSVVMPMNVKNCPDIVRDFRFDPWTPKPAEEEEAEPAEVVPQDGTEAPAEPAEEPEVATEVAAEAVSSNGGTAGEPNEAPEAAPAETEAPPCIVCGAPEPDHDAGCMAAAEAPAEAVPNYATWKGAAEALAAPVIGDNSAEPAEAEAAPEAPAEEPAAVSETPKPADPDAWRVKFAGKLAEVKARLDAAPAEPEAAAPEPSSEEAGPRIEASKVRIAALDAAIEKPAPAAAPEVPKPQPKAAPSPKPAGSKAANGWDDPEVRAKRIAAIKAARERKAAAA